MDVILNMTFVLIVEGTFTSIFHVLRNRLMKLEGSLKLRVRGDHLCLRHDHQLLLSLRSFNQMLGKFTALSRSMDLHLLTRMIFKFLVLTPPNLIRFGW